MIWADFEQERVAANAALQCNLSVDITRKMQKAEAPLLVGNILNRQCLKHNGMRSLWWISQIWWWNSTCSLSSVVTLIRSRLCCVPSFAFIRESIHIKFFVTQYWTNSIWFWSKATAAYIILKKRMVASPCRPSEY